MNRRDFLRNSGLLVAGFALAPLTRANTFLLDEFPKNEQGNRFAEGFVFHDRNGSGKRDESDPGIAGIAVSNGREVVLTDRNGRWKLPVDEDTILFVIKPSGWKVPLGPNNLPKYYYIHKPKGSPNYRYPGVSATGPLPTSIDFPLEPQKESNKFRMVLFGDPQPRNQTEIDYISHDVVEQVARDAAAMDAKFGLSLGDEMFDILSLYESLNQTVGTIGVPWYNTVGNHDLNFDSADNEGATDTFHRVFGPSYYAFNYAKVHFIVLNDVIWEGSAKPGYHGEITAKQLEFVKNDLATVPKDRLVVIAMHIPILGVKNREELYRLIEDRPYTFSLSAHTHLQEHYFLSSKDGWRGKDPHHHLNHVTVCGSWWEGAFDERGIPHATMSDGGPNGYSIIEFDNNRYKVTFRAASRPADDQMNIWLPELVAPASVGSTEVIVNVFAGSELSLVEMRVGSGDWTRMANSPGQDPYFLKLKELEAGPKPPTGLKLPNPSITKHLWKSRLPAGLAVGTHAVEVKTTDMFGQTYVDRRILRVG
ncbi:MAG: calcineurin-like phosphoesterase C-terminal domain-containing protein [Chlorobia bacterium]|nr:calcineurin-like phosphoesterase C-terminal domain-containing protein [Fimbriimonadaceae bacterium]